MCSYDRGCCVGQFYVPTKPLSKEAQKDWDMMVIGFGEWKEIEIRLWIRQVRYYINGREADLNG